MNTRTLIIALTSLVLLVGLASADGIFAGRIIYKGCAWVTGEYVVVKSKSDPNFEDRLTISCCQEGGIGFFNSYPTTYPPGNYVLYVDFNEALTECDHSTINEVIHGLSDQGVDITVYGEQGQPD
jgi:hypothetical protein